jgi:hypothetical protein
MLPDRAVSTEIVVVLKTKTNLYFYGVWHGISYFPNYYSISNSIPSPFYDNISI